MVLFTWK